MTISLTQDIAHSWLIPKLPEFYQLYPEVAVTVVINDFISDLVNEQIDVVLRVSVSGTDSMLIVRELGSEKIKLFAGKTYLEQNGMPKSLADLQQHRWITFHQMSPRGIVNLRNGRRQKTIKPDSVYETNSPATQRCMLEAGLGIGVHLPSLAQNSVESGVLKPILETWSSTAYSMHLVYPSRDLPARMRALVEYLVTAGW